MNWGYTEVIYEGKDGAVSVYRAPSEHIDGMRAFILSELDHDPNWIAEKARVVEAFVEQVIHSTALAHQKPMASYDNNALAAMLSKFFEDNCELGPLFIVMLWFPIQMEGHPYFEKYRKAVESAIEARNRIQELAPIVDSFVREIAVESLKRAGEPETFERFVSLEDVLAYLKRGTPFPVGELEKRRLNFLVTNDGIKLEPLEKYLERKGFGLKKLEGKESEIRGQIAFPGNAIGKVKIIKNKQMFGKFQDGDVIVSPMTTPDYVPLLQKASAIVTDEGGITCHAAIISRELKKPCITGTKRASLILKDGDIVEVDADKGIVRKIEG